MAKNSYHPHSNAIAVMIYDDESGELVVTFTDDKTYAWDNFPEEVLTEWVGAASQGRFFNARVRGKY